MKCKILGADYCGFCQQVREYVIKNKITHEWIDTETKEGASERNILSKQYNYNTIPMVFIDDKFIGGCQEFFKFIQLKS